MITIYTLIQESVTGLNGEKVTCGHLSCNEKSTLRLNDVLRNSGDYTFQMKIKAKAASTVQLSIGTLTQPGLSALSRMNYAAKCLYELHMPVVAF